MNAKTPARAKKSTQPATSLKKDVVKTTKTASGERLKHFVLDTNVLLIDPQAVLSFKEHTVHIPMAVLEELDKKKKGLNDVARNARQITRTLGELALSYNVAEGIPLAFLTNNPNAGLLYLHPPLASRKEEDFMGLDPSVMDNHILVQAKKLRNKYGEGNVYLITNDVNLQVKAAAMGLEVQVYRKGRVLGDEDYVEPGFQFLPEGYMQNLENVDTKISNRKSVLQVDEAYIPRSYLIDDSGGRKPKLWQAVSITKPNGAVQGTQLVSVEAVEQRKFLKARNIYQVMANHLLFDKDLDLVSLMGKAGTGKTMLALAAGLEQVMQQVYDKVVITRATIPMGGEDIGFLPGSEEDKMAAWLGGVVDDCFDAMGLKPNAQERSNIQMASISFMRGRSFQRKFVIVDEAQNLSVQQIKGLISRAGEGSKVVLTGNLGQIDTPYLDESTSGLTWAVKKFQAWNHAGHIIIPTSVRSRMTEYIESE